jgi:hypothetical protein
MIKNKLNNYIIFLKNDRLTHVNLKLYTKCRLELKEHQGNNNLL